MDPTIARLISTKLIPEGAAGLFWVPLCEKKVTPTDIIVLAQFLTGVIFLRLQYIDHDLGWMIVDSHINKWR